MMIFYLLIVILLFLVLPIIDYIVFKLHSSIQLKRNNKVNYYIYILLELWIPIIFIIIFNKEQNYLLKLMGIGMIDIDHSNIGNILALIILIITIIIILYLMFDLIRVMTDKKYQEIIVRKMNNIEKPKFVNLIQPETGKEQLLFIIIAVSAGIIEEILYRGALIQSISHLLPKINIFIILIISSIAFGLGHLYQGINGFIRTFIIGIIFGLIYLATNTIILCVVIHILIDISSIMFTRKCKIETSSDA